MVRFYILGQCGLNSFSFDFATEFVNKVEGLLLKIAHFLVGLLARLPSILLFVIRRQASILGEHRLETFVRQIDPCFDLGQVGI